jgi:Cdc6-like AAA superfamily ATPase
LQIRAEKSEVFRLVSQNFDNPLNGTSSMHALAEINGLFTKTYNYLANLVLADNSYQLLRKVVSKGVIHQVWKFMDGRIENSLHDFRIILSDLLLQESAPSLVLSKCDRVLGYKFH